MLLIYRLLSIIPYLDGWISLKCFIVYIPYLTSIPKVYHKTKYNYLELNIAKCVFVVNKQSFPYKNII